MFDVRGFLKHQARLFGPLTRIALQAQHMRQTHSGRGDDVKGKIDLIGVLRA